MTKKTPAGGREDAVQGTQHADTRAAGEKPAKASETDRATGDASDFGVVGVCGSAGALEAFQILLDNLPTPLGLALVIVPHLDPSHPSLMAQLLASHTPMRVEEVADGVALAPDRVYVIPPGRFLAVANGRLLLSPVADGDASATGRQTVIDLFLRSLAEDLEHRALGVVLSGTGSLGTLGLREIKEHGGVTLVQDPASAGFDSMPRSAIAAGVADRVLSPKAIAGALVDYARRARASGHWRQGADADTEPEQLGAILALLRARTKYDFRCYRKGMLLRRVRRRMGLRQLTDLPEYVARLRSDGEELGLLFRDLLIGVTGFFRDPKAFEVLEQRVLDPLARRADGDRPVRIWVPGCASGEEAYSIAMLTIEAFARRQRRPNLQIFATDINDQALETARQGRYPKGIAADVSPRRLQRFFVEAGSDSYRVTKQLRDAVVFAPQNLISDAPFSKLDLVSCRNLLIYLEPEVQRQIVAVFHFALRPDGYLLLGPSEGVGQRTDLFATVSKRWRLFRRAGPSRSCDVLFPAASAPGDPRSLTAERELEPALAKDVGLVAQRMLLDEYGPAAVLINRRYDILHLFGPIGRYLELSTGRATLDLMALLRQGLSTRLRGACQQVLRDQTPVVIDNARVKRDGGYVPVQVRVRLLREPRETQGLLLVSFVDVGPAKSEAEPAAHGGKPGSDAALAQQLEQELKATREDLQSSIEEMESANEELKASNEEAMSMNEELQSANEELETSKEELQSLNEELSTVNSQLEQKIQELEHTNDDINNLLSGTEIATVFLDTEMRIKRFTPQSARLLNLRAGDTGRPLAEIAPNLRDDQLLAHALSVLEDLAPIETEILADDGTHYLRRIQPYRTRDNRIEGVVVTFIDITLRIAAEAAIRSSEERYRMLFERSPMCLLEQDWSEVRRCLLASCPEPEAKLADWVKEHPEQAARCRGRVRLKTINKAALRLLSAASAEQVSEASQRFFPLDPPSQYQALLDDLLRGRGGVHELATLTLEGTTIPTLLHAVPAFGHEGSLARVLVAVIDISERKAMERQLADREQRLAAILDTVADGVIGIDRSGSIGEFNAAAERLFGCPARKAIGEPLQRFLLPGPAQSEATDIVQMLDDQAAEGPQPRLCQGVRANGDRFPVEMLGAEIDHLGIYVLLVRDISQRRELERQIIETSTREQERIGQEIHDGLGQQLTAVALLAAVLAGRLERAQRPEAGEARKLSDQVERALVDAKRVTQGLAPIGVAPERLIDALEVMADQVASSTGVRCEVHCDESVPITSPLITAHLYRIAQEAVNNSARHGKPSRIEVRLARREGMLRLSVRDDGHWATRRKGEPGGLGLHIMGYRASILGGTLTVRPQPEGGTLMLCEIPLPSEVS